MKPQIYPYQATLRLAADDKKRLDALAAREHFEMSALVRILMQCGLAIAEKNGIARAMDIRSAGFFVSGRKRAARQ
jgi:hypothetical protein